jgi:DNA-binding transcriptional MerR regulator
MKSFKQEKILYSITEIAEIFDVNTSLLRYWEKEFDSIRPIKSEKGTRQYREKDIKAIRQIYHLVKEKGLTLAGAKQRLKDNGGQEIDTAEIVHHLKTIKTELLALKDEFNELGKQIPEI